MFKIKTMIRFNNKFLNTSSLKTTTFGRYLRIYKLDELPQLFNVLIGEMSIVGPRPDLPGFADKLKGDDKLILSLRPGITSSASIFFKNEEEILAKVKNPVQYNKEVIWPQKVTINKLYIENYSFKEDLRIIIKTIFG